MFAKSGDVSLGALIYVGIGVLVALEALRLYFIRWVRESAKRQEEAKLRPMGDRLSIGCMAVLFSPVLIASRVAGFILAVLIWPITLGWIVFERKARAAERGIRASSQSVGIDPDRIRHECLDAALRFGRKPTDSVDSSVLELIASGFQKNESVVSYLGPAWNDLSLTFGDVWLTNRAIVHTAFPVRRVILSKAVSASVVGYTLKVAGSGAGERIAARFGEDTPSYDGATGLTSHSTNLVARDLAQAACAAILRGRADR